jgi:hypothetical protein
MGIGEFSERAVNDPLTADLLADAARRYKRIPGTSQRYADLENPGRTISRRQYENIRARALGFRSYSEIQTLYKIYNSPEGKRWANVAAKNLNISRKQLLSSSVSKQLLKAHSSGYSKEAHGSFAQFLEDIGLRDKNAGWPVSDKARGRHAHR